MKECTGQFSMCGRSALEGTRTRFRGNLRFLKATYAPESACSLLKGAYFVPGTIYVNDRNADSICDTELAFFDTKSSYMPSHERGLLIEGGT
jgi:hypothetical protein